MLDCIDGGTVAFAGLGVRTEDAEVMRSAHEDTFAEDLCAESEKQRNGAPLNRVCRTACPVESIMSTRTKAARVALINGAEERFWHVLCSRDSLGLRAGRENPGESKRVEFLPNLPPYVCR